MTVYQGHTTGGTGNPECHGFRGFEDIKVGTTVTVRNSKNEIVGVGSLQNCTIIDQQFDARINQYVGNTHFAFSVPNLPDSPFYSVEVSHRGLQNLSRAELEAKGWTIALSVSE